MQGCYVNRYVLGAKARRKTRYPQGVARRVIQSDNMRACSVYSVKSVLDIARYVSSDADIGRWSIKRIS